MSKSSVWYIIVNPRAGSGKTLSEWNVSESELKALGLSYEAVFTQSPHHAAELAETAAKNGFRDIVAVGGDGTFHEIFDGVCRWCLSNGVSPSEFHLGVIPIGSGNDWIKSFSAGATPTDVVNMMAARSVATQDIVKVTASDGKESYMANVGGVGFDPHVCKRVNDKKAAGVRYKGLYCMSLLNVIMNLKSLDVAIYCDGQLKFKGAVYDIAFGNGRYCGDGMRQCCLAEPDDGLLDVLIIPKAPIVKLLPVVPKLFSGTIDQSSKVVYLRGRHIRVEPLDKKSEDIFELDGEVIGSLPVTLEILETRIGVLSSLR